jgi:hypothetical protein
VFDFEIQLEELEKDLRERFDGMHRDPIRATRAQHRTS